MGYFVGKLLGKYPDDYCERNWPRDNARYRAVYVGGRFEPIYSVQSIMD